MRWKLPEKPVVGAIRYQKKFAWTPKIVKGYKIWFETYFVVQEYDIDRWVAGKFGYKVPCDGWFFKDYELASYY